MSNYVLDKAYRVAPSAGVEAGRAVVRGANPDECDLPSAANEAAALGITTHSQPRAGRFVGVRRLGIVRALAAGPIEQGSAVCIADADGRIAQCERPRFITGSTAANNGLVFHWNNPADFFAGMRIAIVDAGTPQSFSWDFDGATLRLIPSNDGSILQTADELIQSIQADADLSLLISVAGLAGSSGGGTLAAETVAAENLSATRNPFAIAEEPAGQAGDLIDVFINP
jgi:hypothetical protein